LFKVERKVETAGANPRQIDAFILEVVSAW
jgi:hypothetical protein